MSGFLVEQDADRIVATHLEPCGMGMPAATEALGDQGIGTAKAAMGAMAIAVAIAIEPSHAP